MTPEQKQLFSQIEARYERRKATMRGEGDAAWSSIEAHADVGRLLSLVKSQEAGGKFARSVAETIAADLGYQGGTQNQRALAATIETALNNFATSMRSACVEKVRAMRDEWIEEAEGMTSYEPAIDYSNETQPTKSSPHWNQFLFRSRSDEHSNYGERVIRSNQRSCRYRPLPL